MTKWGKLRKPVTKIPSQRHKKNQNEKAEDDSVRECGSDTNTSIKAILIANHNNQRFRMQDRNTQGGLRPTSRWQSQLSQPNHERWRSQEIARPNDICCSEEIQRTQKRELRIVDWNKKIGCCTRKVDASLEIG